MSGSIALNTPLGGSVVLAADNTAAMVTVKVPAKNNSVVVVTDSAGLTEIGAQGLKFEDGTILNTALFSNYILDNTEIINNATGALEFDLSAASIFNLSLAGNVTGISVINAPALQDMTLSFVVRVSQGTTAYALTWFPGITWLAPGGIAPAAPAANKTIEYIFSSTATGLYTGRKGAAT